MQTRWGRALVTALAVALLVGAAGSRAQEGPEPAAVAALEETFEPQLLTVPVGTTVVWKNDALGFHTVTADDGSFDSDTMRPGRSWSYTFSAPGEYPYHCVLHGKPGTGQYGTVTVVEPSGG